MPTPPATTPPKTKKHEPALIEFRHTDEFPMTVTGKIRKVEMRDRAQQILGIR